MKKLINNLLLVLVMVFAANTSNAQKSKSYESLISGNRYIKVTITMEGTVAYVSRDDIDPNPNIASNVYNLTDLIWQDGRIEIPETGQYWFIPYDDSNPFILGRNIAVCYVCHNEANCSNNTICDWRSSNGGCESCLCGTSASSCIVLQGPCDGQRTKNGGIIIQASEVIVR